MSLGVSLPVCDVVVAFSLIHPYLFPVRSIEGEYVNSFCLQPFGTVSLTFVELLLQVLDTAYRLTMSSPLGYSSG